MNDHKLYIREKYGGRLCAKFDKNSTIDCDVDAICKQLLRGNIVYDREKTILVEQP